MLFCCERYFFYILQHKRDKTTTVIENNACLHTDNSTRHPRRDTANTHACMHACIRTYRQQHQVLLPPSHQYLCFCVHPDAYFVSFFILVHHNLNQAFMTNPTFLSSYIQSLLPDKAFPQSPDHISCLNHIPIRPPAESMSKVRRCSDLFFSE